MIIVYNPMISLFDITNCRRTGSFKLMSIGRCVLTHCTLLQLFVLIIFRFAKTVELLSNKLAQILYRSKMIKKLSKPVTVFLGSEK